MIYLKIASLIISIWFTSANALNGIRGHEVSWDRLLAMSAGWVMFIFSMGWLR